MAGKSKMRAYIFVTADGYTYQPGSEECEPDIENCQVIGFARGMNERQALGNLLTENEWLLETTFDKMICYELRHADYDLHATSSSLREADMKGGWRIPMDVDGPDMVD